MIKMVFFFISLNKNNFIIEKLYSSKTNKGVFHFVEPGQNLLIWSQLSQYKLKKVWFKVFFPTQYICVTFSNAINTLYNLYYDYWNLITKFWTLTGSMKWDTPPQKNNIAQKS